MVARVCDLADAVLDDGVRLWLYHLAYDVSHGNLGVELVEEFIGLLADEDPSLPRIASVAETLGSRIYFRRKLSGSALCNVSRVMSAHTFTDRHAPGSWDCLDGGELLELLRDEPDPPLDHCTDEFRGRAPLFFVAPDEDLDSIGTGFDDLANEARDALGMSHIEAGFPLVRVQITAEVLGETGAGAPTCFDAMGHPPFSPVNTADGWGRTLHLGSFVDRGSYEQDGCREAVAAPMRASRARRLLPLGTTSSSHEIDEARMKKLLSRARRRVIL